jgi:hypothetical protein
VALIGVKFAPAPKQELQRVAGVGAVAIEVHHGVAVGLARAEARQSSK